jgi:hypothetical protein
MLLGLSLLYVGAVLCLNGLWLLGRIGDKEIWVINVFSGGVTLLISLQMAFGANADAGSIKGAALTLLFSFTYLWVAFNRFNGADGRGLGWFSLFVAITAIPVAIETGLSWAAWAVLWFMFFLLLVAGKQIAKITGVVALLCGIFTAWLPGFLLLNGVLK